MTMLYPSNMSIKRIKGDYGIPKKT